MNIAGLYWIARGVVRDTPATVALIIAASAVVIATYALGCRKFRLRLLTVHLIALAALTVVSGIAVVQMVRAGVLTREYHPAGGRVERFADQILAAMCVLVLLLSLVSLTVQGGLAWRLWRHRLRPDLAPTHRMTRSFGHNLAIRRFRMPSPAGIAIHLGLLGVLGAPAWWF
jgi:hypothetical protein